MTNCIGVHGSPETLVSGILDQFLNDIIPCHYLKQPGIISLGLPMPFLPLIFSVVTMFPNAFLLSIWPKNAIYLILIVFFADSSIICRNRQIMSQQLAMQLSVSKGHVIEIIKTLEFSEVYTKCFSWSV